MKSIEISEKMWKKYSEIKDFFPKLDSVKQIDEQVNGTAFFPGGAGIIDGTNNDVDILVLGQDFGTVNYFNKLVSTGKLDTACLTWKNMLKLFECSGLEPSRCFFSNVFMGLRTSNKITDSFTSDKQYISKSLEFLKEQIRIIRPKAIITLGNNPTKMIIKAMDGGLESWDTSGKVTSIRNNSLANFEDLSIYCVALLHPSMRYSNIDKRDESTDKKLEDKLLKDMIRTLNIATAKDTLDVIEKGYYLKDGKKIFLPNQDDFLNVHYDQVTVLSPETLSSIANDDDDFFAESFCGSKSCSFYLIDADSFEVASSFSHGLVMNFANAKHPGGGFLSGASAQEESLCRCSTLYKSLSSKKASEMYTYNSCNKLPGYSDYMLLTKDVCVFKDRYDNYLDSPFLTSVMTIPAPNAKGCARELSDEEQYSLIKQRLTYFLFACARYGYRDLVLGAWGCGAFGNDPRLIARCFYELFFTENKFEEFFDNVAFAVLGGGENYNAFLDTFGDRIEALEKETTTVSFAFQESSFHRPICNHSINDISSDNIGYTFGIFSDGVPFEADLWTANGERHISVYIPDIDLPARNTSRKTFDANGNVLTFESSTEQESNSVLGIGMAIRDTDKQIDVKPYVEYLEQMGAITFESDIKNGGIEFYTDIDGNDVVCINIFLESAESKFAVTSLNFREFPNQQRASIISLF